MVLYVVHVAPKRDGDLFVAAVASVMSLLPGWRAQIIGDVDIDVTHTETSFVHLVRGLAGVSREIAGGVARAGRRDPRLGRESLTTRRPGWTGPGTGNAVQRGDGRPVAGGRAQKGADGWASAAPCDIADAHDTPSTTRFTVIGLCSYRGEAA